MRKRIRKLICLSFILVTAGLAGCSNPYEPPLSDPLTGERAIGNGGGAAAPIPIGTAADFAKIGNNPNYPLNGDYILTANLTLANWVPIGDETAAFSGSFDGNRLQITLQSFDAKALQGKSYLGIFGYVAGVPEKTKAALTNLKIASSVNESEFEPPGGQAVGLLAGYTENTVVDNITLSGVFGFQSPNNIYVGGIVGYAQAGTVIQNSSAGVAMTIDGGNGGSLVSTMFYNTVGGIVGLFKDGVDILNCHNTGNISGVCSANGAQVFVGGIAGGSYYYFTTDYQGSIQDCSSTGDIAARCSGAWSWAGGIAGCIVGDGGGKDPNKITRIQRCYATGTVSVAGSKAGYPYVGGIVAYNYYGALVSQCWFYGSVLSNTDANYTGGIAGYNSQTGDHNSRIEDCWSGGLVAGLHNAGGIVGQNQVNTYVRRCYSRAEVDTLGDCDANAPSTNPGLGGIAGFNASNMADSISACVALNSAVRAAAGSKLHRVVGYSTTTTLSNNYALDALKPYTGDGTWTPDYGLDRVDGATYVGLPPQSLYESLGWDFTPNTGVWEMNVNGYPELQWQGFYPTIPAQASLPAGI